MNADVKHAGLESVLADLEGLWGTDIQIGRVGTVLGPVEHAGSARPMPSSAAELRVADERVWIPVPHEPHDQAAGQAPLYIYSGRTLVMPTIRLFTRKPPTGKSRITKKNWPVEYLSLADWLKDALTRWRFNVSPPAAHVKDRGPWCTVLDWLKGLRKTGKGGLKAGLEVVARTINFALLGSRGWRCWDAKHQSSLLLPACPMWLRPVEDLPLGPEVARRLVVTSRYVETAKSTKTTTKRKKSEGIPAVGVRGKDYRIRPTAIYDWGLDPVHTPEGHEIRLTGRLGLNVGIRGRRLKAASENSPQLSVSASRIPFAGYDDSRRLLMAANMQAHAVEVTGTELPLVRQDDLGLEPPGVNLRVGYLAWQGWNHEDAWVVSESAALRLGCIRTKVYTIAVRSIELAAEVQVQVGQAIRRGDLLVKRRIAPGLLITSLKTLGKVADVDDIVQLRPEVGDHAKHDGEVAQIDIWDLRTGEGVPADWERPPSLPASFRQVIRIRIRSQLPLAVGDKLANRHGHKGIVGRILPDAEMPCWQGQPLGALIDPISVLNRSNWGQVYESLAGIVAQQRRKPLYVATMTGEEVLKLAGATQGRSSMQPPAAPGWLTSEVRAVAGIQFVMRLPHHACEKISASPAEGQVVSGGLRRRRQRLGEMEQWALWAHGLRREPGHASQLSPDAVSLSNVLAAAGFELAIKGKDIVVKHFALDKAPPGDVAKLHLRWKQSANSQQANKGDEPLLTDGSLADAYNQVDAADQHKRTVIVFDPPIPDVLTMELGKAGKDGKRKRRLGKIRWIGVVPKVDRPMPPPNAEIDPLTQDLRRVVRAYRRAHNRSSSTAGMLPDDVYRVRKAIQRLLRNAYVHAVGKAATGIGSSKTAMLRHKVLGQRLRRSVRATAAPTGSLQLGLDEIGVPRTVARAVLATSATTSDDELSRLAAQSWIWIKRDPVLHRWGLLPVRIVLLEDDDVIRLPASLLGPMNADFDGDIVALFARLPGAAAQLDCRPPTLARHDLTGDAMFVPKKQYVYGLHLLTQDVSRLQPFRDALHQAGAPEWPTLPSSKDALEAWVKSASERTDAAGHWWGVLEAHALQALAEDPGMGLGPMSSEALKHLPVIQCKASKLFDGVSGTYDQLDEILAGKSLDAFGKPFEKPNDAPPEPIAEVMVAGQTSIGNFGGALRRLIYRAGIADSQMVRRAQCLTEQATQRVLSVKAGAKPMPFSSYNRFLRRLMEGGGRNPKKESPELRAMLDALGPVWGGIRTAMPLDNPPWQRWLLSPHQLAELVADGELRLPLEDIRVRPFCKVD